LLVPILSLVESAGFFSPERTRAICDAFDGAWAVLQHSGSKFIAPALAPTSREILAKRIIGRALEGVLSVAELRDDAIAYLKSNPPK
jgi:hypothetical protein